MGLWTVVKFLTLWAVGVYLGTLLWLAWKERDWWIGIWRDKES